MIRRAVIASDIVQHLARPSETNTLLTVRNAPSQPNKTVSQIVQTSSQVHDPLDLIAKILSERTHISTAYTLEYRIEIDPSQLVALTESGIQGKRTLDDIDVTLLANEGENTLEHSDIDHIAIDISRAQTDPSSRLQMWAPGCMIRQAKPKLITDYEEELRVRPRTKKTKKRASKKNLGTGSKRNFDWQKWSSKR